MKIRPQDLWFRIIFLFFALLAFFGFKCPAQGCPACKYLGQ